MRITDSFEKTLMLGKIEGRRERGPIAQNSPSQSSAIREPRTSHVQAGFTKGKGTRDQIANIRWITKKARVAERHLFLLY